MSFYPGPEGEGIHQTWETQFQGQSEAARGKEIGWEANGLGSFFHSYMKRTTPCNVERGS